MSNFYDKVYYKEPEVSLSAQKLAKFERDKEREMLFMQKLIGISSTDRVLDVGCGDARFLSFVQDTGADLWGIDISEIAIEKGKQRIANPEQLICSSAIPLPFKDNHFDVVTAWGVVEHFDPISGILEQIHRVLKPQGRAMIAVPNLFYYKFVWDAIRKGKGPTKHQEVETLLSYMEWRDLLIQSHLKVTRVKRHNKFNKPQWVLAWKELTVPFFLSNHFIFFCTKD